jgi:hypothetical protein
MADISRHSLKPGDEMRVHNQTAKAMRVRVETQSGTVVSSELHPGAVVTVVVGREPLNVFFNDVDPLYDGPSLVSRPK